MPRKSSETVIQEVRTRLRSLQPLRGHSGGHCHSLRSAVRVGERHGPRGYARRQRKSAVGLAQEHAQRVTAKCWPWRPLRERDLASSKESGGT